jgi:hypothetical protein
MRGFARLGRNDGSRPPDLVGVLAIASPYLDDIALGGTSVREVQTEVGGTPLNCSVRVEFPLLVLVVGAAAPGLKFSSRCGDTVLSVETAVNISVELPVKRQKVFLQIAG